MSGSFTIRPKQIEGEALTSYLPRICKLNEFNLFSILKGLSNEQVVKREFYYYLDLLPDKILKSNDLAYLLGLNIENLNRLTFKDALIKLSNSLVTQINNRSLLANYFIRNKRRFCVSCLKENEAYKLLWQINELEICNVHNTRLKSCCAKCLKEVPYILDASQFTTCVHCGDKLIDQPEELISDQDFLLDQQRKYEDWLFLLDSDTYLVKDKKGLSKEQQLAAKTLYSAQQFNSKYIMGEIKHVHKTFIKRFRKLIVSPKVNDMISLGVLLDALRDHKISLSEFAKIETPESYIASMSNGTEEKIPGSCMAPWCKSNGTNKSMKKALGQFKRTDFNVTWVCTDCFIKYGFHKLTGEWLDIYKQIDMAINIKDLLEGGASRGDLYLKYGFDKHQAFRILGYLTYHRLLSEKTLKKYFPKVNHENILDKFKFLFSKTNDLSEIRKEANQLFGWDSKYFYYYYASKEVQDWLIFIQPTINKEKSKDFWRDKAHEAKEIIIENEGIVTGDSIVKALDCTKKVFAKRGLLEELNRASTEYKKLKYNNESNELWKKAKDYVSGKKLENKPLSLVEAYKVLGKSQSRLKERNNELYEWLRQVVSEDNILQQKKQLEEYKERLKEGVYQLASIEEEINLKSVSRIAGIAYEYLRRYPELKESVWEARNSIRID